MNTKEKTTPARILRIIFNLKSLITTPLVILFIITQLSTISKAKEPTLAILNSIYSNEYQKFTIKKNSFLCKQYGIITLEEIYKKSEDNPLCRREIENFYIQHPSLKNYAQRVLEVSQRYHIKFIDSHCLVYARGHTTLSQMLLSQGVATVSSQLKNREFIDSFKSTKNSAQINKIGLWGENIKRLCAAKMLD